MNSNTNPVARGKLMRNQLEAATVRALVWVVPRLPSRLVQRLGQCLGLLGFYFLRYARRIALANLDTAFGETKSPAEKKRIARRSFQSFGATMVGQFWAPRVNADTLADLAVVDPASLERLRAIQARGKGIIFITLHFGNWELIGLASAIYGFPTTVVSRTMRNPSVDKVFADLRARSGNDIISSHRAVAKLLKTLRQGGGIALLIDQQVPPSLGGVWVNFFELPALTTSAIARLALHTGAAIVGGYAYPLPNGRTQIVYEPEIEFMASGDTEADVLRITQQCLDFCERVIRERPEFWLWSYKRWKHRPDDTPRPYPFYTRQLGPREQPISDASSGYKAEDSGNKDS